MIMKARAIKLCILFILCFSVNCIFGVVADAKTAVDNIVGTNAVHITKNPTVIDLTDANGFHACVNIANSRIQLPPFCSLPVGWKLEWEILKSDRSVYMKNVRGGDFYGSVASASEDFYAPSLKYGYLRICLTTDAHGDIETTGWQEYSIGFDHGGGGGKHRTSML